MRVLLNQTRLIPIYVDIVKVRAPRYAVTDLSVIIRGIYNELSRGGRKVQIRFRHNGKRRNVSLKVQNTSADLKSKKVEGVLKVTKGLKSRYALFEYATDAIHRRGLLIVILDKESLFLTADKIILRLEQPVIKLSDVVSGYEAIGLVVEQTIDHLPSKNLVESIDKDVYVFNIDITSIAYRPFRYTI